MTRIETALGRGLHHECEQDSEAMTHDESAHVRWLVDIGLLATPTGQALSALVEAAETWWPSQLTGNGTGKDDRLNDALRAWLAATEPQT